MLGLRKNNRTGLLPAQVDCTWLLRCLRKYKGLGFSFGSDEELVSAKRIGLSKAIQEKADIVNESIRNGDEAIGLDTFVHFVCEMLEDSAVGGEDVLKVLEEQIEEMRGMFWGSDAAGIRWSRVLFMSARREVCISAVIVSSLGYIDAGWEARDNHDDLIRALLCTRLYLVDTSYDDQLNMASFDTAIEQTEINRSMKRIAIASMVIAVLSIVVSVIVAVKTLGWI